MYKPNKTSTMKKENLVYIKGGDSILIGNETFKPNVLYRCEPITENGVTRYIVFGINLSQDTFKETFDFAYDRIMFLFTSMGLIKNGKVVSRTAFSKIVDIHQYGTRRGNKKFILFVSNCLGCRYGFYPSGEVKAKSIEDSYRYLVETIEGNMGYFDIGRIQFGNCGIPLMYGNLRVS